MMPWVGSVARVTDLTAVSVMGRCLLASGRCTIITQAISIPLLSLWNVVVDRLERTMTIATHRLEPPERTRHIAEEGEGTS